MVSDSAIMSIAIAVFNYFVVYKKSRLLGNILFIGIGMGIIWLFLSAGETLMVYIGVVIIVFSVINLIYDLLREK